MLAMAYVTLVDQSEHGYGVRNAVRLISARRSRILINAAPCGGLRRPHSTLSTLPPPQKRGRKPPNIPLNIALLHNYCKPQFTYNWN